MSLELHMFELAVSVELHMFKLVVSLELHMVKLMVGTSEMLCSWKPEGNCLLSNSLISRITISRIGSTHQWYHARQRRN